MDKLKLDIVGGMPLKLDDLLWQNGDLDAVNWGLVDAIQADLLAYGTDYIVEGCTYAAPNITAGWIMLDSELMRVDAHAGTDDFFVKTITFDARGSKTFKNTTVNNTYQKDRGVLSGASGSLNITTALRLEDKVIQLLATSTQELAVANIPNLPASKTTSGTFDAARIPNLSANKITTDTLAPARLPAATTSAIGAVEKATLTEIIAKTTDKYIDALLLNTHEAWQTTLTFTAPYVTSGTNPIRYRRLNNGLLQINGQMTNPGYPGSGLLITTFPANYRPTVPQTFTISAIDGTIHTFTLAINGQLTSVVEFNFNPVVNVIIPLD